MQVRVSQSVNAARDDVCAREPGGVGGRYTWPAAQRPEQCTTRRGRRVRCGTRNVVAVLVII